MKKKDQKKLKQLLKQRDQKLTELVIRDLEFEAHMRAKALSLSKKRRVSYID